MEGAGKAGIRMPSVEAVCMGMGKVIAGLHWGVGINARDVELVLGGDGDQGVRCWSFDYNQVSSGDDRYTGSFPSRAIQPPPSTLGEGCHGTYAACARDTLSRPRQHILFRQRRSPPPQMFPSSGWTTLLDLQTGG
jgi:hypothetical protein